MNKDKILAASFLLCAIAAGADLSGIVTEGGDKKAKVSVNGELLPAAGDSVEIFFKLAGADDEISVATGKVIAVSGDVVDVAIQEATGTVEKGQSVRFSSPASSAAPSTSSPSPAESPERNLSSKTSPEDGVNLSPAVAATKTGPTPTPSEAVRCFMDGLTKFDAQDLRGALAAFTKAIELDPTYAKAYANRASIYNSLKQSERGLTDGNEAIRLNPQLPQAYVVRGNCYADIHQLKRAIEDYDEAIRLDPKNTDAHNNRGIVYGMLGQNKVALENFTQAIGLDPAYANALTNRARLYQAMGKTQLAKRDFARVKELKARVKPPPAPAEQNKEKSP